MYWWNLVVMEIRLHSFSHSLSKIYCGTWESRRSGCFGYRYFLCILFFELEIHEDYHIGALVPREKGVFCRQLICTSNVRVLEIRQFGSA